MRVTLFIDPLCPISAQAYSMTRQLMRSFKPEKVSFVITLLSQDRYKDSITAAKLGFIVNRHGKLLQYLDSLYSRAPGLSAAEIKESAAAVGVNTHILEADLKGAKPGAFVNAVSAQAYRIGLLRPPLFVVNGVALPPGTKLPLLEMTIIQQLKEADLALKTHPELKGQGAAGVTGLLKEANIIGERQYSLKLEQTPSWEVAGGGAATVKVTFFADFKCAYSRNLKNMLGEVMEALPGKLAVYVKHLPQTFHPTAPRFAAAATCAWKQKRFTPVFLSLFDDWFHISALDAQKLCHQLKLDCPAFIACLNSSETAMQLEADADLAAAAEIKGTPALMINGRKVRLPKGFKTAGLVKVIKEYFLGAALTHE